MAASKFQVGGWYKVEIPVTATKSYQGRLVRVIDTKDDGTQVLQFQGRFPFSASTDELIAIEETDEPSKVMANRLQRGNR